MMITYCAFITGYTIESHSPSDSCKTVSLEKLAAPCLHRPGPETARETMIAFQSSNVLFSPLLIEKQVNFPGAETSAGRGPQTRTPVT